VTKKPKERGFKGVTGLVRIVFASFKGLYFDFDALFYKDDIELYKGRQIVYLRP
jgi:hypothetical protein